MSATIFVLRGGYFHLTSLHSLTHTDVVYMTFRTRFITMVILKIYPISSRPQCSSNDGELCWKKLTSTRTHHATAKLTFFPSIPSQKGLFCIYTYPLSRYGASRTDGYCKLLLKAYIWFGHTTTQAVRRWFLIADTRVQFRTASREIHCGRSGTIAGFSPSSSVLSC
jgi:hypothetical protein